MKYVIQKHTTPANTTVFSFFVSPYVSVDIDHYKGFSENSKKKQVTYRYYWPDIINVIILL